MRYSILILLQYYFWIFELSHDIGFHFSLFHLTFFTNSYPVSQEKLLFKRSKKFQKRPVHRLILDEISYMKKMKYVVVAQWCNPLPLQPEQSGGVGS